MDNSTVGLAKLLSSRDSGSSFSKAMAEADVNGLASLGLDRDYQMYMLSKEDPALRDASADMLVMAQGPKAFTYMSPELTTALRVSNATKTKDPLRLTGIPSKAEISAAKVDKEALDKLLWKGTGNGLKANAWIDASNSR